MRDPYLGGMDFAVIETATFQIPAIQVEKVIVNSTMYVTPVYG